MLTKDLIVIFVSLALSRYLYRRARRNSSLPLPPGPQKLPLIGNLFDLPTSYEWETYARWGKKYGSDLLHLSAAGTDVIIVNSAKAVDDLFNKRSSNYSSRPQFTMASELVGWSWLISGMPYGEPWRERRRLFTQQFPPSNDAVHRPREVEFVQRFLVQILDTPDNIMELTRHTIGGISLSLAYGLNILPFNDPYINLTEKAVVGITETCIPGAFLVDTLPWLKYVPEWVPGAGFQKKARIWRGLQEQFRNKPFDDTLANIANGTAQPSLVSLCLESLEGVEDEDHQREVIKDTAGMFFAAGADTTVSSLHTFILAMICFPEIQAKAQHEIDNVVGRDRLPEFKDEGDIPYLGAILKEVTRWRVVAPIAIPRMVAEDDVYDGYHLPAKSIIVANVWAMMNDEKVYHSPSTFIPERFLKEDGTLNLDVPDPMSLAFGFGRRECPGKHISLSTFWLMAASILSAFEIEKALDENGRIIEPDIKYQSAMVCHPQPFRCILKPRSSEAEKLLRSMVEYG